MGAVRELRGGARWVLLESCWVGLVGWRERTEGQGQVGGVGELRGGVRWVVSELKSRVMQVVS